MMRMFVKPSHTRKSFNYLAAAAMSSSSSSSGAKRRPTHVIRCGKEKPQDKDPKDFYIRTLTAVLGSEEAAKKAYVKDIVKDIGDGDYYGFVAADLTPEQARQISKQPYIYRVEEDNRTLRLCRRM